MTTAPKRGSQAAQNKRLWVYAFSRRLAVAFMVFAVLAVLAGVVVRLVVTPEALRSRIAAQLEKNFKRPVRIDHVSIVLHQGLKITGLRVFESKEFPGDVFLSSEFLIAKYKLPALLRGRFELSEVRLMAPHINLVRRQDGVWNLEDILGADEDERPRKRFSLPPMRAADTITIERGRLSVHDMARRVNLHVRGFRLNVRNFRISKPFPIQVGFINENSIGGKEIETRVEFKGGVSLGGFKPEKGSIDAKNLTVFVDGHKIVLSGMMNNFKSPDIEAKIELPRLTSEILSRYRKVPDKIDFPASKWNLKVRMPYRVVDSTEAAVSTPAVSAAADPTRAFHIEKLEVTAWPVRLIASGDIAAKGDNMNLKLQIPRTDLKKASALFGALKEREIEGTAEGALRFSGPLKAPQLAGISLQLKEFSFSHKQGKKLSQADVSLKSAEGWKDLSVRVSKGRYVAYVNAFSDIDTDFSVAGTDLIFKKADFIWNESRIALRGCMKNFKDREKVFFDGVIDRFKVDETYAAVENIIGLRRKELGKEAPEKRGWAETFRHGIPPDFPDLEGRLMFREAVSPNFSSQNFKLEMAIGEISQGLNDVTGVFKIGFGPGRIQNVPEVRQANGLLNVLIFPFSYMHEIYQKARFSMDNVVLKTLDITRTYGDFSVLKGKVHVGYIHFDSPQFAAYADGIADFSVETVDLDVIMRSISSGARLPDRLVDASGRPSIRIKVKDNLNMPKAEINLQKIQKDDLENVLQTGLRRGTALEPIDSKLTCGRK